VTNPALRTPDSRFIDLPGYPFEPNYLDVVAEGIDPVRMHYLDEGPADGPVALLLQRKEGRAKLSDRLTRRGISQEEIDNILEGVEDLEPSTADDLILQCLQQGKSKTSALGFILRKGIEPETAIAAVEMAYPESE
jgi:haloalkane dehalogenase